MSWKDYFDEIYVINLEKRTDRLVNTIIELDKWEIDFKHKIAVECDRGAEGLLKTTIEIFNEALSKGYERIFIMEDDCIFLDGVDVNEVLDKAVSQLPDNWLLFYGGGQMSLPLSHFHSPNLIPVQGFYATHCYAVSKKGMELILSNNFDFPIDNFYDLQIQRVFGNCYCTYPMIATQREGYSDIGKMEFSWRPFIETRMEQRLREYRERGGVIPQ